MNKTTEKALYFALQVQKSGNLRLCPNSMLQSFLWEALCRSIEHHEAFRQEVSDDVTAKWHRPPARFQRYVIAKPETDALLEVLLDMELSSDREEGQHDAKYLRAKLDALGYEIREKNND